MGKKIDHNAKAAPDEQRVKSAVDEGRTLINGGSTKIAAALAIFERLEDQPQDVVWKALMDGASLTHKGAMTYWYTVLGAGSASRVSSYLFLVPVFSFLIAWPVLGEAIRPGQLVAALVVAVGVRLATQSRGGAAPAEPATGQLPS